MRYGAGLSFLGWSLATLLSFTYPPTDPYLGAVQRLLYVHLGSYYSAFGLFLMGGVAGIAYLNTRNPKWDYWGHACLEIALWFLSITIITGICVARPVWGVYWVWDTRLTSVAVMWLTYFAYFFLRISLEDTPYQQRLAAIYAIFAFGAVILSMLALHLESSNLTSPVLNFTRLDLGFSQPVGITIWVNILAYGGLGLTLVSFLCHYLWQRDQLNRRKIDLWEGL